MRAARAGKPQRAVNSLATAGTSHAAAHTNPRVRTPLRQPMRSCTQVNGPHGLSAQRQARTIKVAGLVGCRPEGSSRSRDAASISKPAWKTSTPASETESVRKAGRRGALAASASRSAVPTSTSDASLELRHHLPGEEPQALEHLRLGQGLHRVDQEVDAVHADRLPALDRTRDLLRVADADALGRPARSTRIAGVARRSGREVAERLIGAGRVGLARPQEMRVGEPE